MNDAHHPFNLLGRNGTCPALFSEKVHHMCGKFITCLRRKERFRNCFVLPHKDRSSGLSAGGRQHQGAGDPCVAPSPPHTGLGEPGRSCSSQGSRATTAQLLPRSSLPEQAVSLRPQPSHSGEERSGWARVMAAGRRMRVGTSTRSAAEGAQLGRAACPATCRPQAGSWQG